FNVHRHRLTREPRIAVEDDDVVRTRASGELQRGTRLVFPCRLAWPLHQHLYALADPGEMVRQADLILDRQEIVVAAFLDLFWHVVGIKLMSLGAGPRAVFEDVAVLESRP